MDTRKLLDALVGAVAQAGGQSGQAGQAGGIGGVIGQAAQGLRDAAQRANEATGIGPQVDAAARQVTGLQGGDDILQKARDAVAQNPGLAQAAAVGVAGLLLGSRRGRGVLGNLVGLGGLALIGGLAYRAYQNHQAARKGQAGASAQPTLAGQTAQPGQIGQGHAATGGSGPGTPGSGPSRQDVAQSLSTLGVPESSGFHPVSQTEDDALLYARAMVAAAAADGHLDQAERTRITQALAQAGIDAEATHWLEREMEGPLDVEDLAAGVNTPEKAAQVYTAARLAVDPDTIQEREFLRQLAVALDLDEALKAQIDSTATTIKGGSTTS